MTVRKRPRLRVLKLSKKPKGRGRVLKFKKSKPIPAVIRTLEQMLRMARAGHLRSLAIASTSESGEYGRSMLLRADAMVLLAALEILKTQVVHAILKGEKEM